MNTTAPPALRSQVRLEDAMLRAFDWLTSRVDQMQQMQAATVIGELRHLRQQMAEMEKRLPK